MNPHHLQLRQQHEPSISSTHAYSYSRSSRAAPAPLNHDIQYKPHQHMHLSSATHLHSPPSSLSSSSSTSFHPPVFHIPGPVPRGVYQPAPPPVAMTSGFSLPAYLRVAPPPVALSQAMVNGRTPRPGTAYVVSSSRSSAAYEFEPSRSLSAVSDTSRPPSRSQMSRSYRHAPPAIERIEEDPAPAVPPPPPPARPARPSAAVVAQVVHASRTTSRAVSPATSNSVTSSDESWSVFFLSLPASPAFLDRLSLALIVVHAALLFLSLLFFVLVAASTSAFGDLLSVYLLFYAVKSALVLSMAAYRKRHPDCWHYDDPILSSVRSQRFHLLDHAVRCISVAAAAVMSWMLFSGVTGGLGAGLVGSVVLVLLVVEYVSIVLPLLANLALSFFVPCIHLSFYLPYLPFPSMAVAGHRPEEDKAGMTDEDLMSLPTARYHHAGHKGEDATCAVCLSEIEEDEEVRVLSCRHMYHRECIDVWLRKNHQPLCPLCLQSVRIDARRLSKREKEESRIEMARSQVAARPSASSTESRGQEVNTATTVGAVADAELVKEVKEAAVQM